MTEQCERSKLYARKKYLLFGMDLILTFVFLLVFQFSGLSRIVREEVAFYVSNPWLVVAGYFLFFYVLFYLFTFAFSFYRSYVIEHQFGLSTQTVAGWLKDQIKRFCVAIIIGLIVIEGFYWCLHAFEHNWWLWAGGLWLLFTIILDKVAPVVIFPLFYKHTPLRDEDLKQRLIRLAKGMGFTIANVFEIDFSKETKKANAALAGLGRSRRILLADTLLNSFTPDEIEVVMAHELGHHALRHIAKMIFFGTITTFTGLWVIYQISPYLAATAGAGSIADIMAFPLIAFMLAIFSLILMPVQNGFSRRMEYQADRFALKITQQGPAFKCAMNKLADQNLADRDPHWFIEWLFYSHPAIAKRIKLADEDIST